MSQHDDNLGEPQDGVPSAGDMPDEVRPGRAENERERRADVAEHEAAVPSSTEHDEQRDVAAHEAAVPSSAEDVPPGAAKDVSVPASGAGSPDVSGDAAPPTGDGRVDEALSRLAELDGLDVTQHAGVVEDVHRALQDTLAEEED